MSDTFGVPLSGLQSALVRQDVAANNIANAVTPGFQAQRADQVDIASGGARISATTTLRTPGGIDVTGGPFDLAVDGDGFFAVRAADGGTAFTRAGQFHIDAGGNLVTADGSAVLPGVQIPPGATGAQVTSGGQVNAVLADGTLQAAGQIQLARFPNPGGLTRRGGNLLTANPASGAADTGAPAQGGFGSIVSGALEGSNVDLVGEMVGLLESSALFKANLKVVKAKDETLGDLLDLKG